MLPQTTSTVLIIALFLLPGFIGHRYAERTYAARGETTGLPGIGMTLYYSLLSYVVLAILAAIAIAFGADRDTFRDWLSGDKQPWEYLLATFGLLATSVLLAEAGRQWRNSTSLRPWILNKLDIDERHTVVSGWEWFFNRGEDVLIIVTLKNDKQIAGYYGFKSYSGYTHDGPDLYLEQRWVLDDKGWFKEPASGTQGVFIRADEIQHVEFYGFADPVDDEPEISDDDTDDLAPQENLQEVPPPLPHDAAKSTDQQE